MQISILSTGSRGDTQPYVALGMALKKSGHSVRLAAFENYASFVESHGLEFSPIKGDVTRYLSGEVAQEAVKADNPLKFILSFNKMMALASGLQQYFLDACQGADVIVYHPGALIGYFIAQELKIPSVLATPFPMTPTRAYPSMIFYDRPRLGSGANWLTHKILEQIFWTASNPPIKQYWKQNFGRLPEHFGSPFTRQNTGSHPTIVSCSDLVFPRPPDWPEHVHNTGYWFLDDEAGWTPPGSLLEFLENGPAPVYVGFGSISSPGQAAQTTRLVIEALRRSGRRGVLATGWNGLAAMDQIPADIFILESAPHTWLFPRMAAVVHHGGAGTTAAGLRAGVPEVVVPHANDQFAWGRRVYELGVGAKPIPRKNLSVERLAAALEAALRDEIRSAARELGARIQAENGAETAARIISNL